MNPYLRDVVYEQTLSMFEFSVYLYGRHYWRFLFLFFKFILSQKIGALKLCLHLPTFSRKIISSLVLENFKFVYFPAVVNINDLARHTLILKQNIAWGGSLWSRGDPGGLQFISCLRRKKIYLSDSSFGENL